MALREVKFSELCITGRSTFWLLEMRARSFHTGASLGGMVFVVLIAASPPNAKAADSAPTGPRLGARALVGASTWTDEGYWGKAVPRLSLGGSVLMEYFLHPGFGISAGVGVLQKGAKFTASTGDQSADDSVSLVTLQVPIVLTARLAALRLGLGLAPEYVIFASAVVMIGSSRQGFAINWRAMRRRNMALVVDVAYEFRRIFGTGWTAIPGLTLQSQLYDHQVKPAGYELTDHPHAYAFNGLAVITMYYELN